MSARRVFIVLVLIALSIPMAVSATTRIPGTFIDAAISNSLPASESRDPKCIDMSGIDQALEELLMCLRGEEVKTVVSGLVSFDSQSTAVVLEESTAFSSGNLAPARALNSLIADAPALTLRKVLVDRDKTNAYFDDPQIFAFNSSGNLIYADSKSAMMRIIDENGSLICEFGGEGDEPGKFRVPSSIATDGYGRIFVADRERGDIQVFTEAGEYIGVLAQGLSEPVSMACFSQVEMFVLERETAKVHVYDLIGMREVRSFGGVGEKPGRFRTPSSIAITKLGSVVIADTGNDRVQVLDRRGKSEQVWDDIRFPQYVAADSHNNVYILADTIRKVTSSGNPVGEWNRSIEFADGTRYYLGNGIYPGLKNTVFINDNLYGNILVYETR